MTLAPAASFWRGRRVLVTGHTGFKGGWLVAWLHDLGAEVHGVALAPPSAPSLFEVAGLADLCEDLRLDLGDREGLVAATARARPEVVLHLAAQPLVRRSYREPLETFRTNVLGTAHVLEAARRAGAAVVVNVTSDKCYRNDGAGRAFQEGDPLGGEDPYSASKAAAEMVAAGYRAALAAEGSGTRVVSVRAGNVLGGGDWGEDRLVPDAVRALAAGRPLQVRSPGATRPWQHVVDPLDGYLRVARAALEGRDLAPAYNFGPAPEDCVPVGELADRLCDAWGEDAGWEALPSDTPLPEAPRLRLDATRAGRDLGWSPAFDLAATVSATVAWYRGYYADPAAREEHRGRMRRQIHEATAARDRGSDGDR